MLRYQGRANVSNGLLHVNSVGVEGMSDDLGLQVGPWTTKQSVRLEALIVQGAYAFESPDTVVSKGLPHVNSVGVEGMSDDLSLHIGPWTYKAKRATRSTYSARSLCFRVSRDRRGSIP